MMVRRDRGSLGVVIAVLALVLVAAVVLLALAVTRENATSPGEGEELESLVLQVEPGMTSEEVRAILGEPRDIGSVGIPKNCPKAMAQGLEPGQVKAWTYWEGDAPRDVYAVIMVRDVAFEVLQP